MAGIRPSNNRRVHRCSRLAMAVHPPPPDTGSRPTAKRSGAAIISGLVRRGNGLRGEFAGPPMKPSGPAICMNIPRAAPMDGAWTGRSCVVLPDCQKEERRLGCVPANSTVVPLAIPVPRLGYTPSFAPIARRLLECFMFPSELGRTTAHNRSAEQRRLSSSPVRSHYGGI